MTGKRLAAVAIDRTLTRARRAYECTPVSDATGGKQMIFGEHGANMLRTLLIPFGPEAAAAARATSRTVAGNLGLGRQTTDVLTQCASELAANVIRHASARVTSNQRAVMRFAEQDGFLLVEAWDPDPRVPHFDMKRRGPEDRIAIGEAGADMDSQDLETLPESGRGLFLVCALVLGCGGFYHGKAYDGGKGLLIGLPLKDLPAMAAA